MLKKMVKVLVGLVQVLVIDSVFSMEQVVLSIKNDTQRAVQLYISACGRDQYGAYEGQAFSNVGYVLQPGNNLTFHFSDLNTEYTRNYRPSYFKLKSLESNDQNRYYTLKSNVSFGTTSTENPFLISTLDNE